VLVAITAVTSGQMGRGQKRALGEQVGGGGGTMSTTPVTGPRLGRNRLMAIATAAAQDA
jgi:hypothetical protein